MEIDTKECIKELTNWTKIHHDSFPLKTGYIGNYYSSGKKSSHWKRRGILKQGDVTVRVFERQSGHEEITPSMIVVDLPEDYIVVHSTKDKIIKIEPMSLADITRLKIKVSTSWVAFLILIMGRFLTPLCLREKEKRKFESE